MGPSRRSLSGGRLCLIYEDGNDGGVVAALFASRSFTLRSPDELGNFSIAGTRREAVKYRGRAMLGNGGRMRETGTPPRQRRPRKEAVRLGKEIYQRVILPQVQADHFGEYVAIDVDSGNWAAADNENDALERLRGLCPDAINVLMERVGYRALRSFGAGPLWRTE